MINAILPLALVRDALVLRGKGYSRKQCINKPPAVFFQTKDLSFVSCGNLPLIGIAWLDAHKNFTVGKSCYINTEFNQVWFA